MMLYKDIQQSKNHWFVSFSLESIFGCTLTEYYLCLSVIATTHFLHTINLFVSISKSVVRVCVCLFVSEMFFSPSSGNAKTAQTSLSLVHIKHSFLNVVKESFPKSD